MTQAAEDVHVRVGTLSDLDAVMELGKLAGSENAFLPMNPGRIIYDVYPALQQHEGIMGLIGKPGEPLEGLVLLRVGSLWYSDVRVVEEKLIFIHPDFRSAKGGRAKKLCEFSKRVADSLEMPLVIGVLSNERTAAKVKMYERIFGQPAGAFFLYGAKTGAAPSE